MAIGAHELLLIVRAQNQAAGLLGRVSRDLRRLQTMKSLDVARSRAVNQMAANAVQMQQKMAKIQSVVSATGKTRLQHEQAVARNQLQQLNIGNRITNLEMRRTSVARAEAGIEVQRLRLLQQEIGIETSLEKIELRRKAIQNQMGRYAVQMMRGQNQGERLRISQMNAEAQVLERQIALNKANSQYMKTVRKGGDAGTTNAALAKQAAQLRLSAAKANVATFPAQRALLAEQMKGVAANAEFAQLQLAGLKNEEAKLAGQASILAQRHEVLAQQLANVRARGIAVEGVEAELNKQLAITKRELDIVNASWLEQIKATEAASASLQVNIEQQRMLAGTLKEVDAELAAQKSLRTETLIRGVGHVGRVLSTAGLIGVAAFGAMAVSAAHFNQEAVRAATQTGKIGSSAGVVVANSARIEKGIEGIMTVIPANQHDLTDALYNIYSSMNTTFGGGLKLLKLFGQVWVAGGMTGDINEVADALITLGNNWHISANNMQEWNKLAASTLATVRFGRLTVQQYTQTMNQLAPAFHGAHQSIEQMNGALAFLTRLLPSQRVTAAGIARMIEQLQRFAGTPKPGFEKLAKEITTTTGNLKPLDQVIGIILKRMPQLKTSGIALTNFFKTVSGNQGTIQARRALQGFVQNFELYRQILHQTSGDQKEFNRSLKAMEQSTGVKWAQFVNDMRVLGLELGSVVLPALLAIVSPLMQLVKWFNGLSASNRRFFGELLAGGAALLFVAGIIASVTAGLVFLGKNLKTAGTALGILGSEAGSARVQAALLTSVMAAAIIVVVRYHKQIQAATGGVLNLKEQITLLATLIASFKIVGIIAGLGRLSEEAKLAGAAAALLRKRLMYLKLMGPIVITIAVEMVLHRKGIDKAVTGWLRGHGLGFLTGEHDKNLDKLLTPEFEKKFVHNFGMKAYLDLVGKASKDFPKTIGKAAQGVGAGLEGSLHGGPTMKARQNANEFFAEATQKAKVHAKAIADASATWKSLFNQVIAADKALKGKKTPTYQDLLKYQNLLDKFQKASKGNQYAAATEYLSQLESIWSGAEKTAAKHTKNMAKIQKQNIANAKSQISDLVSGVQSMYDNLLSANQNLFGEMFNGPYIQGVHVQGKLRYGGKITGADLLQDAKDQVTQFKTINSDLDRLQKRGLSQKAIDAIRAQGAGGIDNLKALAQLNPRQVKEYEKAWEAGQSAIKAATMRQLNSQLDTYYSHGKKIANAIIRGIKSEDTALSNTLEAIILKMFPGLAKQAGAGHPHGRGKNKLPGTVSGSGEYHEHYHVHNHGNSATTMTQMRHLAFRNKNSRLVW